MTEQQDDPFASVDAVVTQNRIADLETRIAAAEARIAALEASA